MSAPNIPNLKTLLGTRRGGSGRGRGRGRGLPESPQASSEAVRDEAVRGTDQDAAGSRVSCVQLGYLHDPYASCFATQQSTRRLPLLNRGTYVRTSAIDSLVRKFIETSPEQPKQIVSLGAGTDTRYFRLRDYYPDAKLIYHEIDFPTNTASKLNSINRHAPLHAKLIPNAPPTNPLSLPPGATSYYSPTYNLHALDLRNLTCATFSSSATNLPNLDPNVPTILLSEMCLCYLEPTTASLIIGTLLSTYFSPATPVALIMYEPILPNDPFGRTMISNLASRNIRLPTLTTYLTLEHQRLRLDSEGFVDGCRAADVNFIWKKWVPEEEKERVAALEMLDELEELELLLKHYCVTWGWRNGSGEGTQESAANKVFKRAWEDMVEQDDRQT
ncbi:leucine carboxyl methyltransferase 1 [Delitschia confertaspora ATCC 74209]|uniref:Leucine carboxyl methyltransferase 1 n=1 Tax=Delitschia confertaspora ATCC 74209 TaxID=1513339 RepID=A0A9P4JF15_9PLEO|nr:leucine carboxyl methyltransferase 1 [Delitschia confertaspora ATCC 74209]